MNTKSFELNTSWTEVASNSSRVLIQKRNNALVRVHIGSSVPADDTNNFLFVRTQEMSFHSLEADDRVYLRADGSSAEIAVLAG